MMTLFYLILLFSIRNAPGSLLYTFFPPRILLGPNILLSFEVFSLEFSVDGIHFYVSPIIGLLLVLRDITVRLGIFFFLYVLTVWVI